MRSWPWVPASLEMFGASLIVFPFIRCPARARVRLRGQALYMYITFCGSLGRGLMFDGGSESHAQGVIRSVDIRGKAAAAADSTNIGGAERVCRRIQGAAGLRQAHCISVNRRLLFILRLYIDPADLNSRAPRPERPWIIWMLRKRGPQLAVRCQVH